MSNPHLDNAVIGLNRRKDSISYLSFSGTDLTKDMKGSACAEDESTTWEVKTRFVSKSGTLAVLEFKCKTSDRTDDDVIPSVTVTVSIEHAKPIDTQADLYNE